MPNQVSINQQVNTVTEENVVYKVEVINSQEGTITVVQQTQNETIQINTPGSSGQSGPQGEPGPSGSQGPQGEPGPSGSIVDYDPSRIFSGSATASISPNRGLVINVSTEISGSLKISGSTLQGGEPKSFGYSNVINGQSDNQPFTTESVYRIVFNYPTSSIGYSTGISEDRKTIYKYMTGSYLGTIIPLASTNSMDLTYRFGANAVGYPITDYKFVLKNTDVITYKGNKSFSTASFTSTGSYFTSSIISGAAVMEYSLSNPLPAQIGISGSEITHITFAKSASISYVNLGTSSLNKYWEGYVDDSYYIKVPTPFPINFLGRKYDYINVSDNGYIQFDALSYTTFTVQTQLTSSTIPCFPNIKVGAADMSMYKVYTGSLGSDSGTFRLWIQGRNEYPFGTPNREYSFIFYSGSERIDLYIDSMVFTNSVRDGYISKVSQISDGYTLFSDFSSSIYSGSGYAVNIWDTPVTSSTVKVKQLSGNTITAYGSASVDSSLINSNLYYVSFENRISTGSQYARTAYSVRDTSSLQSLAISSVNYNSGTDDTTISLVGSLQSDYTASIYSSSYMGLNSNNFLDLSVNYMSQSLIRSNDPNSSFYGFMANSPLTASSIQMYKNTGYSKNILLTSNTSRTAFRIMSSSYSDNITGSLFISYSILPLGNYQSVAYGDYSQVSGLGVVASSSFQYVFGKFNELNDTTSTFVVASGTDTINRKNLLTVGQNSTTISGSLDVSGKLTYDSGSGLISKFGSTFSSSIALTGFLSAINAGSASYFKGSGSGITKIDGAYSTLFTAEDGIFPGSLTSSVFSVNDVMGLPIISVFYDSTIKMHQYPDVIFEKSGSSLYLGNTYYTESKVVVKNNLTLDRGTASGSIYNITQVTGSTIGATTSSIYNFYFANVSSSLYINAVINAYDTESRETTIGEVKSAVKYLQNTSSVIGINESFKKSENPNVGFNILAGGTSASLQVYGDISKVYNWAATITTQTY